MSGRTFLTPTASLEEIPVYLMDPTTGEGVAGVDPGDEGFVARYRRQGETSDTTLTLTAVAANAAKAANQWRDYGDGAYSIVGPTGLYAAGARFLKLHVDCGTPAALADTVLVFLGPDPLAAVADKTEIGEEAALAVAGARDLRFDDTTGTALVVTRKSDSSTVATVPLRRGDRAQPIIGNG